MQRPMIDDWPGSQVLLAQAKVHEKTPANPLILKMIPYRRHQHSYSLNSVAGPLAADADPPPAAAPVPEVDAINFVALELVLLFWLLLLLLLLLLLFNAIRCICLITVATWYACFHRDLAKFFFSCSATVPWMFLLLAALPLIQGCASADLHVNRCSTFTHIRFLIKSFAESLISSQ